MFELETAAYQTGKVGGVGIPMGRLREHSKRRHSDMQVTAFRKEYGGDPAYTHR